MSNDDPVIEVFGEAASDRSHGAAEIETSLVRRLLSVRSRWSRSSLQAGAALLAEGQPAMANLRSLSERSANSRLEELHAWLERRRETLTDLPELLAANAWPSIHAAKLAITISRSSAVAAVVQGAWSRGWPGSVVVFDGTASGRGRDQARLLAEAGDAVSQPDASASAWLEKPRAIVLVGADAVGPSRFVNATGTRNLLMLARLLGVTAMLVADTGKDVSEEVVDDVLESSPRHHDGVGRDWAVFEGVELRLVSARVSEREGVC